MDMDQLNSRQNLDLETGKDTDQDMDINMWLGKDMDMGDVLLSQRRTKRRAQGLWRSGRRNIWERKTPTPSSSLLFSSWASPSFSFASPWLPSAIGPDPSVLSLSVSVPLFGRLSNLDVKLGAALEFGFQPMEPKIKAASKVAQIGDALCLCLCSVWEYKALCGQQYVSASPKILLLFNTAAPCVQKSEHTLWIGLSNMAAVLRVLS